MEKIDSLGKAMEKKGSHLEELSHLLNQDSFEPCKNTPPNEFLIKLYQRFKMQEKEDAHHKSALSVGCASTTDLSNVSARIR